VSDTPINEKKIADFFSGLISSNEKENFVKNLSRDINVNKVLKELKSLSDKAEFTRFFYGRDRLLDSTLRAYKSKRNDLIRKLKSSRANYKSAKHYLNPLRKQNEDLLRKESIRILFRKQEKDKEFFKSILQAERFVEILKENKFNKTILKRLLEKNIDIIKNNNVILENLKDLFEYDESLNQLKVDLADYLLNNVEGERPVKDVIDEAEEKIVMGDIADAYAEVEKTEKIIAHNINQILLDVFNSINVMSSKKDYVDFIENYEKKYFTRSNIDNLVNRANEYRNIILPEKWLDMKQKLKHTNKVDHYRAWYYALQQGRYMPVVLSVKEYIVKEILKKILSQIIDKFKETDIHSVNILPLLDSKKVKIEELKDAYKLFFEVPEVRNTGKTGLIEQFDNYMIYYFYLNYDSSEEKRIIVAIIDGLKKSDKIKSKLAFLNQLKETSFKSLHDDRFRATLENIFNKFINLYNILNEKESPQRLLSQSEQEEEARNFLNLLAHELESEGNIRNLNERVEKLPDDVEIDVLNVIRFDPRFEEYFPEVEDTLYHKDWGRTFGIIGLKVKKIEKELGMIASEEYLEDLAKRVESKLGKNSFVAKKIINMKNNLRRIHAEGTKKLHYLQDRLNNCKTPAEKILELQRISRDSRFKGVFGVVRNMERILIRDDFNEIYKKVKKISIDSQVALFKGIEEDLKILFEYEPNIVKKVQNYIDLIYYRLDTSTKNPPKVKNEFVDSIEDFEDGDIPLIDLSDLAELDMPDFDKYETVKIEDEIKSIKHDVGSGDKYVDDLDLMLNDIKDDITFFKIEGSEDSNKSIKMANKFKEQIDENINKALMLEELKNNNKDEAIKKIMNDGDDVLLKIDELEAVFKGFDSGNKAKGYIVAVKKSDDNQTKTKLNEIVEVIRRIEKEVDPLYTLENKISVLLTWINDDYNGKEHIIEFLYKQIKDLSFKKGREGGLLRKLLDGLDHADDKIKYLKDCLKSLEYQHMKSTIETLLKNIKKEMGIRAEDITEEWIVNEIEDKSEDEQLDWLKLRENWIKYENHKDFIKNKINEKERKLLKVTADIVDIFTNMIELAEKLLTLNGPAERQNFIRAQEENDEDADDDIKGHRRLFFYLFSSPSDDPKERLKSIINRVTLSVKDKQKYLRILAESKDAEKGALKDLLKTSDEDIAYYAVYVLYSDRPMSVRIKYLERFRNAETANIIEYKNVFKITQKTIGDVLRFLNTKMGYGQKTINDESIPASDLNVDENKDADNIDKPNVLFKEPDAEIASDFSDDDLDVLKNYDYISDKEDIESKELDEIDDNVKGDNNKKDDTVNNEEDLISDLSNEEKDILDREEEILRVNNLIDEDELKKPDDIEEKDNDLESVDDLSGIDENMDKDHNQISSKTTQDIINEQKMRDEFKKREELRKKKEKEEKEKAKKHSEEELPDLVKKDEIKSKDNNENKNVNADKINNETLINEPENANIDINKGMKNKNDADTVKTLNIEDLTNEKKDKITNHLEELSKKRNKEVVEQIRAKAHEIYEDKNKRIQEKLQSLLSYLVTCYPEIVTTIINDEILPVFEGEGINRDVHNLLQSINDSIFKQAMRGNAVDDNMKFFAKSLSNANTNNIIAILNKIKDLWNKQIKELENQEDKFNMTLEDIKQGRGIESILAYLDNIYPEIIINELNKNFIKNLKGDKIKEQVTQLNDFLIKVKGSTDIDKKQRNTLIKSLGLNNRYQGVLDSIINKILKKKTESNTTGNIEDVIDKMDNQDSKIGVEDEIETSDESSQNIADEPAESKEADSSKLNSYQIKMNEKRKLFNQRAQRRKISQKKHQDKNYKETYDEKETKNDRVDKSQKDLINKNLKQNKIHPVKKSDEKNYKDIIKEQNKLFKKNEQELLRTASKEINKKLDNIIKAAMTRNDLESIYYNYFGNSEKNKKNLLNLCYDIKKIAQVINDDPRLLKMLYFDKDKMLKKYNSRIKKLK